MQNQPSDWLRPFSEEMFPQPTLWERFLLLFIRERTIIEQYLDTDRRVVGHSNTTIGVKHLHGKRFVTSYSRTAAPIDPGTTHH